MHPIYYLIVNKPLFLMSVYFPPRFLKFHWFESEESQLQDFLRGNQKNYTYY